MGKLLQVRVSVATHEPEKLAKIWPRLFALAWPDGEPVYVVQQGVTQLIETLEDALRFADWPEYIRQEAAEGIGEAAQLRRELDKALADWDARKANSLSDAIEDCLSLLEKRIPKL